MRIVCTGYGTIAPKTKNTSVFLKRLQRGVCVLEQADNAGPKGESNIIGIVRDGLEAYQSNRAYKRIPKAAIMGMVAAKEAIECARIDTEDQRIGLFVGTSLGSLGEKNLQDGVIFGDAGKYRRVPITAAHYANYHTIAATIGHELGINGITKTISTGCTAGLEAMEDAMLYLKSGKIDVAIVGGADSAISKATTYAFNKMRVLPLNQSLEVGAVPFSENSKGFAMAEGAAFVVLEREDTALHRKAEIIGEIINVVSNNDGIGIFTTDESGTQLKNALQEVLENNQPDFVNSQALGLRANDRMEENCSKYLFNHHVPFTSIKGMYGNPFAASGILQVISSLLCIQHNFIPPTIRTDKKGYESMNLVTTLQYQEVNEVAITCHGLGGNNACTYIKKYIHNDT